MCPRLLIFVFAICMAVPAMADDQTRSVQSALSEGGFYFGTVDGKMGEDTRSALRRFQIRNGLDVSGEMSAETLTALKVGKTTAPSRSEKSPVQRVEPDSQSAADEAQIATTARPSEVRREDLGTNEAPVVVTNPGRSPIRRFFEGTDLKNAPNVSQTDLVFRAQQRLAVLGYYQGVPDGLAGRDTEEAVLRFQYANQLRRTGQLDSDTRQALEDAPPGVASKSFRRSVNRPPGVVLRGIWVQ